MPIGSSVRVKRSGLAGPPKQADRCPRFVVVNAVAMVAWVCSLSSQSCPVPATDRLTESGAHGMTERSELPGRAKGKREKKGSESDGVSHKAIASFCDRSRRGARCAPSPCLVDRYRTVAACEGIRSWRVLAPAASRKANYMVMPTGCRRPVDGG